MDLSQARILVTGGRGFLGKHLVDCLIRSGVTAIAQSSSVDLRNQNEVSELFRRLRRPDLVFHLAARVGGIGANRREPGSFFYDNMMMGLNVLEQARLSGVKKVVIVGTACSYPKYAPVPFRESGLWNGYPEETNAPYGIAKKALLVMAQAYRQQFECNFIMCIPANLYGPGDNFDLKNSHVIPAMIRKFDDAKRAGLRSVTLWGDGSPTREFLYVDDAARGLLFAAKQYDSPEPINLGTGHEISIKDLAAMIAEIVGYDGGIEWDKTQPNGQPRRSLDASRARELLGFAPEVSLRDGLASTVEWYKANRDEIFEKEKMMTERWV